MKWKGLLKEDQDFLPIKSSLNEGNTPFILLKNRCKKWRVVYGV
ncbi:hypothetical protein [Pseudoneobacillus sp. C159]